MKSARDQLAVDWRYIIGMAADRAPDRGEAVRSYDADGRLHVENCHISKAAVNQYLGSEIPAWQSLGLERGRLYKLFRDPDELAGAADSFNSLPLMSRHVAVTAADHKPDLVIGSTGTDAEFVFPYLNNSLVVWSARDIEKIESGVRRQLSCAYRYRPDMSPGVFQGEAYDGIMRDICGSHVSIVDVGRAGADVTI